MIRLFLNLETNIIIVNTRYYSLADRLPALYAAVALDPDLKLKYFEIEWSEHPGWIEIARTKSKELWNLEYKLLPSPISTFMPGHLSSSLISSMSHPSTETTSNIGSPSSTNDPTVSR